MFHETRHVFWVGQDAVPRNVAEAANGQWSLIPLTPEEAVAATYKTGPRLAIVTAGPWLDIVLARLAAGNVLAIVFDAPLTSRERVPHWGQVLWKSGTISPLTLSITLETAYEMIPFMDDLNRRVAHAEAVAKETARDTEEIRQEMALASRLQQDFLPRRLPKVGSVRFGVHFRPASFVSGDMYDVVRLDESHVGFYVADAVGHGMPAALMTMFIKEALQTKRISGNSYEIIPPHEALGQLNADLCRQQLSMCEFCTAVYGVINTDTLEVAACRAGHPAPVVIRADGEIEPWVLPGPLLGILDDAEFETGCKCLLPGDRLLVYSDGVEDAICHRGRSRSSDFVDALRPIIGRNREDLLNGLAEEIDRGGPDDDITVLVLEV